MIKIYFYCDIGCVCRHTAWYLWLRNASIERKSRKDHAAVSEALWHVLVQNFQRGTAKNWLVSAGNSIVATQTGSVEQRNMGKILFYSILKRQD